MLPRESLATILEDPAGRPFEELTDALEAELAPLSEAERFAFDQALKTVGSGAQTALPGVVQGASTGAALGPWGALIGGVAGGAASIASSATRPRPRSAPRPVAPAPVPASAAVTPPPAVPPAPAVALGPQEQQPLGANHAAQLLAVIQDPATLQALASLVVGPLGRQEVPVGQAQTPVPRAAFLNLLGTLAAQAASQAGPGPAGGATEYLRDAEGEYAWDVVSPEARARALLDHLLRNRPTRSPLSLPRSAGDWLVQSGLAEMISPSLA